MLPRLLGGRPVQLRGSRIARALLRLAGWRVLCDGLPMAQGVIVVYPHTSNWDFVVGVLAKWALGLPAAFWGKHTLFAVPLFGRWLRGLGGIPVDRRTPQGAVMNAIAALREARAQGRVLWLALAPEGTRALGEGWRMGFHRVAVEAGLPVGLATLDYRARRVTLIHFWQLSGEPLADFAALRAVAERDGLGCRAALAAPVRPLPARPPANPDAGGPDGR